MVRDDKELAIIAEMLQLREVHLFLGQSHHCTVAGVLQLVQMKEQGQLQELMVLNMGPRFNDGEKEEIWARLPINRRVPLL